jgi:hypothetical protein
VEEEEEGVFAGEDAEEVVEVVTLPAIAFQKKLNAGIASRRVITVVIALKESKKSPAKMPRRKRRMYLRV